MHWKTKLCERLGIDLPIIQAGMAGGITSTEMVYEVSNAGGLGTLGAAYMKPEEIRDAVRVIKSKTDRPFAVNLFVTDNKDQFERIVEVHEVLKPMRERFGLQPSPKYHNEDLFREQLAICFEEEVPIISTAFGLLPEQVIQQAKEAGIQSRLRKPAWMLLLHKEVKLADIAAHSTLKNILKA